MFSAHTNRYALDTLHFAHCLMRCKPSTKDKISIVESGARITDGKTYDLCIIADGRYEEGSSVPVVSYQRLGERIDYSRRDYVNSWVANAQKMFEQGSF